MFVRESRWACEVRLADEALPVVSCGAVLMSIGLGWRRSRGGRIAVAASSGALARVLSSLLTLVSLPLAVRYLGPERFGVWATIASTVVFLNLLDLGIASTLTNHIAHSYALEDREYATRYTTNALALTTSAACIAGLVLAVAWPSIHWMTLFNVAAGVSQRRSERNRRGGGGADAAGTSGIAGKQDLRGVPGSSSQQPCHGCWSAREPGGTGDRHRAASLHADVVPDCQWEA